MKNNKQKLDFPYNSERPMYYQNNGLAILREMNPQKDYIIQGRLAGLLWDIAWNVKEYLGLTHRDSEIEKQPKEVILNKIIFLNGALTEMYNDFIFEMPEVIKQTYYKLGDLKKYKTEDYNDSLTEEEIDLLTEHLNKRLKNIYINSQSQA